MKNTLNLILLSSLILFISGCNSGGGGDDHTSQDRVAIEDIYFEDADFKKHILSEGASYADEVTNIFYMNKGLSSLVGLENFSNLLGLQIPDNNINDITPLQNLTKLTFLNLIYNSIPCADIEALRKSLPAATILNECNLPL